MAIKGDELSKSALLLLGIKFKNFYSCVSRVRPNHFFRSSSSGTLLQLNSTSPTICCLLHYMTESETSTSYREITVFPLQGKETVSKELCNFFYYKAASVILPWTVYSNAFLLSRIHILKKRTG